MIIDDTHFLYNERDLYRITDTCRQNNCNLILISQVRAVIGSPSKDTTPTLGINSADIRLNLQRHEKLPDHLCRWRVIDEVKSKRHYCFDFKSSFEIDQHGVDLGLFITRLAISNKVVINRGAFIYKDDINLGTVRKFGSSLTENPAQLRKFWNVTKKSIDRKIPLQGDKNDN